MSMLDWAKFLAAGAITFSVLQFALPPLIRLVYGT